MADNKVTTIVSANTTQFEAGMARADSALRKASGNWQKSTRAAQGGFQSLGGAATVLAGIVGGISLSSFARDAINAAGELQTLADRTGVSASVFSALRFQIQDAGGTLSGFSASLGIMANKIGELGKGTKSAVDDFARLGLRFEDLKSLSPEQQFFAITQAIGKLGTGFEKTEAARNIFGRGAASLIPIINQTSGAVGEFVDQQVELGNALSDAQIARLDDFGDAISRAGISAGNAVAGGFADVLSFIDELDARLSRFNRLNSKTAQGGAGGASAGAGTMGGGFAGAALAENEKRRQQAIADYIAKAQGGGFVTQPTFGSVGLSPPPSSGKPSGGGMPTKGEQDAAKKRKDTMEDIRQSLIRENEQLEIRNEHLEVFSKKGFEGQAQYEASLQRSLRVEEIKAATAKNGIVLTQKETAAIKEKLDAIQREEEKYGQLEEARKKADEAERDRQQAMNQFATTFSSAFEDAIVSGAKLRDVLQGVASDLLRIAVRRQITEPLFNAVSGEGGLLSGFGKILGFANGGNPPVNRPSIVGERGAELFVPRSAGTIIPNHALGGGGGSVNVIVNNNAQASVNTTQQANGNGFDIMVQIDQLNADLLSRPNSRTSQAMAQRMQQRLNKR